MGCNKSTLQIRDEVVINQITAESFKKQSQEELQNMLNQLQTKHDQIQLIVQQSQLDLENIQINIDRIKSELGHINQKSIYEKIGGDVALSATVDIFYKKLYNDEYLQDFFKGIPIEIQKEKQKKFLTFAFGGPVSFGVKDLHQSHAHLKIGDFHFDQVARHLQATLKELKVEEELIQEVMKLVSSTRSQIVNQQSLFIRLGGQKAVEAAVEIFYKKILSDDIVNSFFKGVNMEQQKAKQRKFLTLAFGGLSEYTGKDMKSAHAHMNINDKQFNAVAGHLQSTLQDLNVDQSLIKEVLGIVESTRPQIVVQKSLYEKLGGAAAIEAAVEIFYKKILSDDIVNGFFKGVNMEQQKTKQRKFLTLAFGGPSEYTGKDMKAAHAHMNINDQQFNAIAGHLQATLQELKVDNSLINEVLQIVESTRPQIISQKSLYEQLGGGPAIEAAVEIFYKKVLSDNIVNHFFKGVNMEKQKEKQRKFMTLAFGGPSEYTGKDMKAAHAHLQITNQHFNAISGHLNETLVELNVTQSLIDQVLAIVETTRQQIVNK